MVSPGGLAVKAKREVEAAALRRAVAASRRGRPRPRSEPRRPED